MDSVMKENVPNTPTIRERSSTIDVLRGMAMIFIMMIHVGPEDIIGYGLLMMLYYSVPLYFLVSGYLLTDTVQKNSFPKYLWRRIKGLLFPYISFFALSFVWMNTVYAYAKGVAPWGFAFDWMETLRAFVFSGDSLFKLALVPPPLWFLHALFITSIPFYFIAKIKKNYIVGMIAFLLLIATMPLQTALQNSEYWILRLLPSALFFMVCGYLCRKCQIWFVGFNERLDKEVYTVGKPSLINSFTALMLFVASVWVMRYGRGDIWHITSEWYFLGAALFTASCFLLARETKNKVLIFMGKNSLYYLGLHPLILQLPFIESLPQYFIDRSFDKYSAFLCSFIVSLLLISIVVFVVVSIKDKILKPRKAPAPVAGS